MIPIIIGGVALAAVGYAIKECATNEDCIDDIKEKIQDTAIRGYDNIEKLEEKMGLYDDAVVISDGGLMSKLLESASKEEDVSTKISKQFHKQKKKIYKASMQEYQAFLDKHSIQDAIVATDVKLLKQRFPDTTVDDEIESYMSQVNKNLEILSHNLSLAIQISELDTEEISDESIIQIHSTAKSIYDLSHLAFFTHTDRDGFSSSSELNKENILSLLVEVMSHLVKKEMIQVSL